MSTPGPSDTTSRQLDELAKLKKQINDIFMVWMLADKARAMIEAEGYGVAETLSDAIMPAIEQSVSVLMEEAEVRGEIRGAELELECVRCGGHDDVGLLPNTKTGAQKSKSFNDF